MREILENMRRLIANANTVNALREYNPTAQPISPKMTLCGFPVSVNDCVPDGEVIIVDAEKIRERLERQRRKATEKIFKQMMRRENIKAKRQWIKEKIAYLTRHGYKRRQAKRQAYVLWRIDKAFRVNYQYGGIVFEQVDRMIISAT